MLSTLPPVRRRFRLAARRVGWEYNPPGASGRTYGGNVKGALILPGDAPVEPLRGTHSALDGTTYRMV